jgi:hypothetical protein
MISPPKTVSGQADWLAGESPHHRRHDQRDRDKDEDAVPVIERLTPAVDAMVMLRLQLVVMRSAH